jgi:surface protein
MVSQYFLSTIKLLKYSIPALSIGVFLCLFTNNIAHGQTPDPQAFSTTWLITSPDYIQIRIPTRTPSEQFDESIVVPGYNYNIYWEQVGNPSNNGSLTNITGDVIIPVPNEGEYRVDITGDFPQIYLKKDGEWTKKLISINQWGDIQWQSMEGAFYGAQNLASIPSAPYAPDLSQVTSLNEMFVNTSPITADFTSWDVSNVTDMHNVFGNVNADVSNWDVSNVTDMSLLFCGLNVTSDLSNWDVSNVTNMSGMFCGATGMESISNWDVSSVTNMYAMFTGSVSPNLDLSNWDVSSVTDMSRMFDQATGVPQGISNWDVSSVTDMSYMFRQSSFSGDLSTWDVSSVTNTENMFRLATSFNSDLSTWDVSSLSNASDMFHDATSFTSDLSSWQVSNVTNFVAMFRGASSFNSNLSNWDVSSATDLSQMFWDVLLFNSDLSNWSVSGVYGFSDMFHGAKNFESDLSSWDVSSAVFMRSMFEGVENFTSDLSSWNVSSVVDMRNMFRQTPYFTSNLSAWDVSNVTDMRYMFETSGLTEEDYSSTLVGWAGLLSLQQNVEFYAGSRYLSNATSARQYIVDTYNWNIIDAGYFDGNNPPVLDPIQAPNLPFPDFLVTGEGVSFEYKITATDPDDDTLTYSAANLPVGASIDAQTGVLSWTPTYTQAGFYPGIEITVSDDHIPSKLDSRIISIVVGNVNRAPVFSTIPPQEVLVGDTLSFIVTATDLDGDAFTISATNTPDGASFDVNTREFSWTPEASQEGVHIVTFITDDGGLNFSTSTLDVIITVGHESTPTEQAEELTEVVTTIIVETNIQNSYLANLQKAAIFIEDGKLTAAINQLNAFIQKVEQDYAQGIITIGQYEVLVQAGLGLVEDLGS